MIGNVCVDSAFNSTLEQQIDAYLSSLGLENLGFNISFEFFVLFHEER